MAAAQHRALVGKPIDDEPKSAWRESMQPPKKAARVRPSAMNTESMTVTMDVDPLNDEQISAARRTVAHLVSRADLGAEELADTFKMLGIMPARTPRKVTQK